MRGWRWRRVGAADTAEAYARLTRTGERAARFAQGVRIGRAALSRTLTHERGGEREAEVERHVDAAACCRQHAATRATCADEGGRPPAMKVSTSPLVLERRAAETVRDVNCDDEESALATMEMRTCCLGDDGNPLLATIQALPATRHTL